MIQKNDLRRLHPWEKNLENIYKHWPLMLSIACRSNWKLSYHNMNFIRASNHNCLEHFRINFTGLTSRLSLFALDYYCTDLNIKVNAVVYIGPHILKHLTSDKDAYSNLFMHQNERDNRILANLQLHITNNLLH